MTTKTKGLLTVLTAYVIALLLGFVSLKFSSHYSSILQILIADVIATFVIYSFSVYYKNSSFYDPYWSVIPPFIAFFWLAKNNYIGISVQSMSLDRSIQSFSFSKKLPPNAGLGLAIIRAGTDNIIGRDWNNNETELLVNWF